jgi:peptide/nickel transport system ATP-binding protein
VIELRRLTIGFPCNPDGFTIAVRGLSLSVARGERVGIVGESGSGKSLAALACLGLVPEPGRILDGEVLFEGRDLGSVSAADLRRWRGRTVGITFQEASSALNPVYTVGYQLEEAVRTHRKIDRSRSRVAARELLELVAVDSADRILGAYPHQLSGGQAQRVMLALALAGEPDLLIADEPTSSLDVVTRVEIIRLLDRLVQERGLSLLLISHDLEVVRSAVDRVVVMYAGEIVEEAPTDNLFHEPLHPYTQLLLTSVGRSRDPSTRRVPVPAQGDDTSMTEGCTFVPRCPATRSTCRTTRPRLVVVGVDRQLRCPVVAAGRESDRGDD